MNHHASKAAWESKKFGMCFLGIVAIVGMVALCVLEVGIVPAVAAAAPAVGGIVAMFTHRQGKLDEMDGGS